MSNKKSIHILRGSKDYDPRTSEEILDAGQPFYSKKENNLYVGDGTTKLKMLDPAGNHFKGETQLLINPKKEANSDPDQIIRDTLHVSLFEDESYYKVVENEDGTTSYIINDRGIQGKKATTTDIASVHMRCYYVTGGKIFEGYAENLTTETRYKILLPFSASNMFSSPSSAGGSGVSSLNLDTIGVRVDLPTKDDESKSGSSYPIVMYYEGTQTLKIGKIKLTITKNSDDSYSHKISWLTLADDVSWDNNNVTPTTVSLDYKWMNDDSDKMYEWAKRFDKGILNIFNYAPSNKMSNKFISGWGEIAWDDGHGRSADFYAYCQITKLSSNSGLLSVNGFLRDINGTQRVVTNEDGTTTTIDYNGGYPFSLTKIGEILGVDFVVGDSYHSGQWMVNPTPNSLLTNLQSYEYEDRQDPPQIQTAQRIVIINGFANYSFCAVEIGHAGGNPTFPMYLGPSYRGWTGSRVADRWVNMSANSIGSRKIVNMHDIYVEWK